VVPLLAAALYAWLGTPEGLSPQAASAQREHSQQDVAVMVERLAERMEKQPPGRAEDVEGWVMLARSYGMMQRYGDAVRAYGRALQIAPDNAALMADQADMLAMQQGRSLKGEPMKIIERALRADPNNLKALALAGTGAFDEQDYAAAVRYWERARPLAPPDSDFAKGLERSLAEARGLAGGGMPSAAAGGGAMPPATQQQAEATTAAQAPAASIRGRVSLAPALASRVAPDDTVYVFARATEGPKAPLAIVRRSARDLPFDFTLDDSSSMSPQTRLSGFASVIVGARISKSGQAMPQSGDLQGQAGPVPNRGVSVDLVVDSVRP
jgi:cytochrome c-type biogenesis protein CcmH